MLLRGYPLQQACSDFQTLDIQRYGDAFFWNTRGSLPDASDALGVVLEIKTGHVLLVLDIDLLTS